MAFCPKCGNELQNNETQCPNCGHTQTNVDKKSIPFMIIGFLIPLVGIILFFVYKKKSPLKATSALNGAIVGFVFNMILNKFM